ncbi:putative porin [Microbulbifer sp. OS29]|uniref:Porin n=1 Tax=Microbulbifer okhotskensis TaxID=2926617 RepID=A0A9X2ERA9_9GAMM|nr:putative porin [Microbulbifer okhotskensis]
MELNVTEGDVYAEARYNYQLNDTSYIGFDFYTDERFNWQIFSSKYFSKVGESQYIAAGFSYYYNDSWNDYSQLDANYWKLDADYYFTQNTSLGVEYDENSDYKFIFSHFFNRNVAVEASYSTVLDNVFKHSSFGSDIYATIWNTDVDVNKFELDLVVQF